MSGVRSIPTTSVSVLKQNRRRAKDVLSAASPSGPYESVNISKNISVTDLNQSTGKNSTSSIRPYETLRQRQRVKSI